MDTGEVEYLEEYEDILRSCQNNDDTIKDEQTSNRLENVDKINSFKSANKNKNKKKSNTSDKVNTHKGGTNISLIGDIVTVEISSILNAKEDKILDTLEVKEKIHIKPLKTTMMQRRKRESAIKFTEVVNNPPPTPPILPEPYFVDCGPSLKTANKSTLNSEETYKTEIENTNKMKKGEHSILKTTLSTSIQENDTSNNQFKKEKKVVKFKEPPEEKSMKSVNLKVIDTKRNGKIYTKRKNQKQIKVSDVKTLIAGNDEEENMIKLKKTKCKNKEKQLKMKKMKVVIKKLSSKDLELRKYSMSIDKGSNDQTKEIVEKTDEKNVQPKEIVEETNVQTKEIVKKINEKNVQAKEIVKKINEKNVQAKEIVEETNVQTKEIVKKTNDKIVQAKEIVEETNVQTKEIVKKTNEKNVQAKEIVKKTNEKNVQAKEIVKKTNEKNVQAKEIVKKTNEKNVQTKKIVKKTNEKNVQAKEIVKKTNEKNVQTKENNEMNIKDNKKLKTYKRKSTQKIQDNETVLKKLKVTTRNKNVAQNDILNKTNNSNNISALTQDVVLNETNKSKSISISTHDDVLDNTNYSNSTSTLDEKKLVEKNVERKPSTLQSKKIQLKASADGNVDDTNCVIQKTNSISSSEQLTRSNYNLLKYNEIPSFVCVETKILTSIEFQKLKNAKVNAITRLKLKEEEKISKPFIDDHRNEKNNLEMILDDIDAILQKGIFNHKDKVQCIPEENSNSVELIQQRHAKRKAILNKPEFNENSLRNILEFLKIYSSPTVATNSNDNDTISAKQNKNLVILQPDELNKKTVDINLSNSNSNKNIPKGHSVNESGNITFKEQKSSLSNKIKLPQKIESEIKNLNSEQQRHTFKNNEELIITKVSEVSTTVTPNKTVDSRKTIKLPLHLLKKAITTSTPIKNLKLINQKQQENESLTFNDLIISGNCSKIFPTECTSISDNLSNSTTTVESVQITKTT